jgi:hypothetical protein
VESGAAAGPSRGPVGTELTKRPTAAELVADVRAAALRADSVMYRQALAECADDRGWQVYLFDARAVEAQAARILGERGEDALGRPGA